MPDTSPRLTIPVKLALSLGWPVENLVLASFELFLLFYYNEVLGLSGALTGLALLLAMVFDGVSDPILGTFSDNLRNARWGRRHTLMFLAPIPLGLCFVLVFSPPTSLHGLWLFAWLTATAIATRFSCAVFAIPYSTQSAEMSRAPSVRASLAIYRTVVQTIFQFLLIWASYKFFFAASPHYANGQEDRTRYLPYAVALGVVIMLLMILSSTGTYRFMRRLEASTPMAETQRISLMGILRAWKAVLGIKSNVRVIVVGAVVAATVSSIYRSLAAYMGIYFWRLTPAQLSLWQQAVIPGTFVGLFAALALVKRYDTRLMMVGGMVVAYLSYTAPATLHLLGVIPTGQFKAGFYALIAAGLMGGLGLGFINMMSGLMSAEAADEQELRLGSPQQGLLFGFIFLGSKTGSGLGKLFAGIILDFIHFPVGKPAAAIPQTAVSHLGLSLILCVAVPGLLALLIWSRFSITRSSHAAITSALNARNQPDVLAQPS